MDYSNCKVIGQATRSIQDIPDEILLGIFRKFCFIQRIRIERVSKRWLHLSRQTWLDCPCIDDSIFETLATNGDSTEPHSKIRPITQEMISSHIRRCGKFLLSFESVGLRFKTFGLNSDVLKNLADSCPNLRCVDLTNVEIRFAFSLEYFARGCKNLMRITCHNLTRDLKPGLHWILENMEKLHWMRLSSTNLDGSCFLNLSRKLVNLRYLDLSFCVLSESAFSAIGDFCANLAELRLDYGKRTRVPPMQWINNMLLPLMKLQKLTIANAGYEFDRDKLSLGHLCELRELDLQGSWCMNDEMLLSLSKCCNLTRLAIGKHGEGGPRYRYNGIPGLTENGFSYLARLPNLKYLTMTWMLHVAIVQIAEQGLLEEVWLNYCPSVTNECLDALASFCPNLSYLNLSGCCSVSDISMFKRKAHLRSKLLRLYAYGIDLDMHSVDIVHPMVDFFWDGRP